MFCPPDKTNFVRIKIIHSQFGHMFSSFSDYN